MKLVKKIICAIICSLVLMTSSNSFSETSDKKVHCDSAWLGNENVLSSQIKKAQTSSGLPIGSIIQWPFPYDPSEGEWLECNGQAVDAAKYPELYAMIGATPDYRGVFLRGLGGNSSSLGSYQGDAMRNIYGEISNIGRFSNEYSQSTWGVFATSKRSGSTPYIRSQGGNSNVGLRASWAVPTANENRPVNKAVRYLIRAR